MYFKLIKCVLDRAISAYADENSLSRDDVCKRIGTHLEQMSKEHQEDDPSIPYEEPLCRLGYIYKHVGANAYLFEQALRGNAHLRHILKSRGGSGLRVVAVGGGPGSELLGLVKVLAQPGKPVTYMPKTLDFVLLDRVPYWGESWDQLKVGARQVLEAAAQESKLALPSVNLSFYPMDVTDPHSYENYAWLFKDIDIVVFDYVISENLDRLPGCKASIKCLASKARKGAAFVFIDRKEHSERINTWLVTILPKVGLTLTEDMTPIGRTMDSEDRISDFGDLVQKIGQRPRVKFFTDFYRQPTAFYIVGKKP